MIESTDGLYMNRALTLRAVMKAALALAVGSACVSACGFKGPLVMPPTSVSNQPQVEQVKISGSSVIAPVDESGMGVKK